MSEPFIGEICLFPFQFAPRGWALCNGQLLQINQNQKLFSILGTTYGGNGTTTFALPDLRGRVPVQSGKGVVLGEMAGEENHTLLVNEMPAHTHAIYGSTATASIGVAQNNTWATTPATNIYSTGNELHQMHPQALSSAGKGQPHDNMQPYTVLNYCIAVAGIYPSRS